MLIGRDSNPSPLCLPLCLPISCLFNAYANCAIPARLEIQWFFCMLFICKSNSCPSLAVENNDIMNLWPRGPRGFRGPSTKTNQSSPLNLSLSQQENTQTLGAARFKPSVRFINVKTKKYMPYHRNVIYNPSNIQLQKYRSQAKLN